MLQGAMSALRPPEPDRRRSQSKWTSDAGVTVVEMLAAAFILGLGVVGVAMLLVTSARTAAIAAEQSDASALATSELEIVRSFDFELIGIDPSSEGYEPMVDSRTTVTEGEGNLVEAFGNVEIENTVYVIERSVTWASVEDEAEAYKIVRIIVSWESRSGTRSLTVQTGLHEGLFDA